MKHRAFVDDAHTFVAVERVTRQPVKTRLELLKDARAASGLSLDFWADLTDGLPYSAVAILCGRSSVFPKYMNSKDTP